ncbi:shikimate kinase [Nitrosophilus alvini]|uniref:shikimate kinase n=1 Tax=Nitrosophilus alvini TaxID=2714855 RepID=UPI00190BFF14|nr:shikimate kinase [Nitrosophilus alvini]
MSNNIILVGFMGVGKGTVARALSGKTGRYAVDTDDLIESLTNKKIKKIFKKKGEEYFRQLEQRTANWLECCVKDTIVSTGGGFYKVKNLKKIGTVIYLKADFDWIYERITKSPNAKSKIKKRPLFKSYKDAKTLYNERSQAYEEVADITVNVQNRDLDDILNEIIEKTNIS